MSTAELIGVFGAILSALLGLIVALIAVVYRNDRENYKADKQALEVRVGALEHQNQEQERDIATLKANQSHAGETDNRLAQSIDKLDSKIDVLIDVMRDLSRRLTGSSFPVKMEPPRR